MHKILFVKKKKKRGPRFTENKLQTRKNTNLVGRAPRRRSYQCYTILSYYYYGTQCRRPYLLETYRDVSVTAFFSRDNDGLFSTIVYEYDPSGTVSRSLAYYIILCYLHTFGMRSPRRRAPNGFSGRNNRVCGRESLQSR